MLSPRYKYDAIPEVCLNELQWKMKETVENKIIKNIYKFEPIQCCVCNGSKFRKLSEKDRYGFYYPVTICRDCGLVQTNPRMTQESYNEFYQEEYRKLYVGKECASEDFFKNQTLLGQGIFNIIKKTELLPEISRVLEVGCGAGGILKYFKDNGCSIVGIDLGKEYLEYGIKNHGLDLREGSIGALDEKEKFDLIIYNHALEHILNPNEELQLARKHLRPSGYMFIGVPGIKNISQNSYSNDFLLYLQNAHTCHFSLETLVNLMAKNNFKLYMGDQQVSALFTKEENLQCEIQNDFEATLRFLRKLEAEKKRA
jgi:2-polyprenyl-3-methyl-5-hydroxy-6-metoxy-1,4-benzoquinol methylase